MFSLYLLCSLVKVKVKVLLSVKQKVKKCKCKSKSKSKREKKGEKKVLYLLFLSYFLPILTYSYIFFSIFLSYIFQITWNRISCRRQHCFAGKEETVGYERWREGQKERGGNFSISLEKHLRRKNRFQSHCLPMRYSQRKPDISSLLQK